MLEQAHDERRADDRAGAARRTDHAAFRRADRDVAVVGVRAAAAPPRKARARAPKRRSPANEETYAEAVVKEITAPVPGGACWLCEGLVEPVELGGYTIPAGTIVAPCIYLVHHREDIYPHPFRFEPERFLERAPDNYTWLPVRQRCAPLRRRAVCAAGDEARDADGAPRGRAGPRRLRPALNVRRAARFVRAGRPGARRSSSAVGGRNPARVSASRPSPTAPLTARRPPARVRRTWATRPRLARG